MGAVAAIRGSPESRRCAGCSCCVRPYLIKFWNLHFSQFGEDVSIERFVRHADVERSCYIDVGCFHPKKHSNTYRLHHCGWAGINVDVDVDADVDVDEIKLAVFKLARPHDENICCAVGDTPGTVTLYRFGYYSLINTLDEHKAAEYVASGHVCDQIPVRVRTLTEIIESSRFAGPHIGLLSIDVEGHEESVLRSLDFSKYRPRLIMVEFHLAALEWIRQDARYRLLTEEHGYDVVNWVGLTVFFMDGRLLPAFTLVGTR